MPHVSVEVRVSVISNEHPLADLSVLAHTAGEKASMLLADIELADDARIGVHDLNDALLVLAFADSPEVDRQVT